MKNSINPDYEKPMKDECSGMTLIELMVTSMILIIACFALLSAMSTAITTSAMNRESSLAIQAARQQMEYMNNVPLAEIPAMDGISFDVKGLLPAEDDTDGHGEILLYTPADIDGDGTNDVTDLDGDGNDDMIPATVRIQWHGVTGERTMDVTTVLTNK